MLDERVDDCLRVFAIKLYQHHVARLTLDQGRDLAVATAKDQVAFPMPRQSCLGQCAVRNEFAALGAPRSAPRSCICLVRQVAVVPTIALDLPADCRWCSSQSCRDGPNRRPATMAREIFSRWASVNAVAARDRWAGRIPPVSARIRWIEEWARSKSLPISCNVQPCFHRS